MKIFKKEEALKELKKNIEEHPYYKRIDMPKPVLVKITELNSDKKIVNWSNQYTSSKSEILDFYSTHQHLTDEVEILEAMELFGDL
jgi:phosphoenolpyruvate carboxylase